MAQMYRDVHNLEDLSGLEKIYFFKDSTALPTSPQYNPPCLSGSYGHTIQPS